MQAIEYLDYSCPWCGEPGIVAVTRGEHSGTWVEDCAVCCSPIVFYCATVTAEDELLQVHVEREGD
jgi:hypothetical protein